MDEKDRAELYRSLADRGWQRFNSRREVEWKISFALWTALGASIVLLLQKPVGPTPAWWFVVGAAAAVVGYVFVWTPWLQKANERDQKTSYYWESAVEHVLGERTPCELRPGRPGHKWRRFEDPAPTKPARKSFSTRFRAAPRAAWERVNGNRPATVQVLTTTVLGIALAAVAWQQTAHRAPAGRRAIEARIRQLPKGQAAITIKRLGE